MLGSSHNQPKPSSGSPQGALESMATCLAILAAILAAPVITDLTFEAMRGYFAQQYGHDIADLAAYGWVGVCTATVYFLCKAIFLLAIGIICTRALMFI